MDADGYIRIVDRTKDLIKSGGEWISSVELENEIMGHPKVEGGRGHRHPAPEVGRAAAGLRRPQARARRSTEEEVLEYLEPLVAKWWLPDDVVFIDEVPKTSVGKFSKKDLRTQLRRVRAQVEDPGRPRSQARG